MKRCPKCQSAYSDDVKFCRTDGALLADDVDSVDETVGTIKLPTSKRIETAATRVLPTENTDARNKQTSLLDAERTSVNTKELTKPKFSRRAIAAGAALIILSVAACAYLYLSRGRSAATKNSIAVLPFQNASGDPNMEYLSDGITESLINSLSQLPNVRVLARSTMFSFKGRGADPRAVGSQLGVDAVLTGRVVQLGDNLSVQADLVSVSDGSQLWGERYNRKSSDILGLQEEIAREIVGKLRARLSGQDEQRLTKQYTQNAEAYQLYLKGRYYWNKRTPDNFRKAIGYFQQAIDSDPNYALAYSGLADSYSLLSGYGANPPGETMPQAKAAAMKALEIDDQLAEAHASLAEILHNYYWDFPAEERELKRALELNPNYATAHQWYGEYLTSMGRHDEAIAEMHHAVELDPLSVIINRTLGDAYYFARRYDEAIDQYHKTIEIDPNFALAHALLADAYVAKGRYTEAVAEYAKAEELGLGGGTKQSAAAMLDSYAKGGWKGNLLYMAARFEEQSKHGYVQSYIVACVYAELRNTEKAFTWLEKAYQERDSIMPLLKVDPRLDSLRSDPRFADLVRRVGIPQ